MATFITDIEDPVYSIRWRHGDPDYQNGRRQNLERDIRAMLREMRQTIAESPRRNYIAEDPMKEAKFIIRALDSDKSWAYNNSRYGNPSDITPAVVLYGIESMIQSGERNGDYVERLPRFSFIFAFRTFPVNNILNGRGKTKTPSWVKKSHKATWEEQVI